jgi:pSer/pThr/pTyr-binding forkhead associated (FHA) protein
VAVPKLIVKDAHAEFLVDLAPGESVTVGRGEACDVRIEAERASRRHAEVCARGDGHAVRDLGSTNGTTLDGVPLTGERALRDGAEVGLGGCVLVYRSRP